MKLAHLLRDQKTIEAMAADLIRFEATATEADAIRALFGHYDFATVALFADVARRLALLKPPAPAARKAAA